MRTTFNYKHLYYFWVVAKEGGITRAADKLDMAVQTVSAQVRELERSLGYALLKPAGRGLALTDAGVAAMQQADQIFQLGEDLPAKVRSLREKSSSMSSGNIFGMFGGQEEEEESLVTPTVDENDMLTVLERRMARLEKVLHSPADCEFTAVTIPTELATAETKRLLAALREDNILVRRLIVNQVLSMDGQGSVASNEGNLPPDQQYMVYLEGLRRAQTASLTELRDLALSTGSPLIEVPYFDRELRDTAGLQVMVHSLFPDEIK